MFCSSEPAAATTRPRFHCTGRHNSALLLPLLVAIALGVPLSGCDRQNTAQPQAADATAQAQGGGQTATPATRYRVDRSHAGAALPAAMLTRADATTSSLTAETGRVMVINLWATWCAPCVEELPTLNTLAANNATTVNVVAVSQDIGSDAAGPNAFLAERGWAAVTYRHDPENALGLHYGGALPTTIVADADGREVARVMGPLDWTGPVAQALLRDAGLR